MDSPIGLTGEMLIGGKAAESLATCRSWSNSRASSVESLAIQRFLHPVCYQDFPHPLLPLALGDGNPLKIPLRVNGRIAGGA